MIIVASVGKFIPSPEETTWKDFELKILRKNAVDKIVVLNKETVRIYIKKSVMNDIAFSNVLKSPFSSEGFNPGAHYTFNIGSIETFKRKLDEAQKDIPDAQKIGVSYEETNRINDLLGWLLPVVVIFFVFRLMMSARDPSTGGSAMFNFGRSTARLLEKNIDQTSTRVPHVIALENDRNSLVKKVETHGRHIAALVENPFAHNAQKYKSEHEKLESEFASFAKAFRNVKAEVFKITEKVFHSEKVKKLIDWE